MLLVAAVPAAAQGGSQADLIVTVDNNAGYVSPGQNVVYVVTVLNTGPDAVVGATVTGTFSALLTHVAWTATAAGGASSALGSGLGDIADTVDLPVAATVVYDVSATVDQAATGSVASTATVAAPVGVEELAPANNSASDTDPVEPQSVARVQPFYANGWPSPNTFAEPGATPPDHGAVAFNGHVGDWSAPTDPARHQPRYILKTASLGQPLAGYKSAAVDVDSVIGGAMNQLFYLPGAPADQNNSAAFRFIESLYGPTQDKLPDKPGTVAEIERRLSDHLSYDTTIDPSDGEESDEERALRVGDALKPILQAFPQNEELRNLLLDIYYYRTLGRQIAAKEMVVAAYQINFSSVVSDDVAFGTPIDKEIEAYEAAAAMLRNVLDPYRDLLLDNLGVDVATQVDPSYTGNLPFGYYLFQQEVANRSVYASTYANLLGTQLSGDPAPVIQDDSRQAPVLYVTPTTFKVDPDGRPEGSQVNRITFTLQNLGAGTGGQGDLHWKASVKNPVDEDNNAIDMLKIQLADGSWSTTRTSSTPIPPPPQTQPVTLTVQIAPNTSSFWTRTGQIEVTDTSGKPGPLTYTVVIVQQGNDAPIISVSPDNIVFSPPTHSGSPGQQVQFRREIVPVYVQNVGAPTLHWTATVTGRAEITLNMPPSPDWYARSVSGVEAGMFQVVAELWGEIESRPIASTITITDDNDASNKKVITVEWAPYFTPPAKVASLPLLSVYPDVVKVKSGTGVEGAPIAKQFIITNIGNVGDVTVTSVQPWISVAPTDMQTGKVELSIGENTAPLPRTGYVTVRASNVPGQTRTVTVLQEGVSGIGLVVNPAQRYVSKDAGQSLPGAGFAVMRVGAGSISWSARVSGGGDWLRIVSGDLGTNEGEILFAYDENTSIHGRTGEIVIESPDAMAGQGTVLCQVQQQGTTGAQVLTGGFKDLLLLFDVMRDDAQVNKELAKRYALRRLTGDIDKAYSLIDETIAKHTAALAEVGDIIPNWWDQVPPNSDLTATYMGWKQAIDELATVKDFLNGNANILGFQDDFLFLVQQFEGQDPEIFDSFDKLLTYMFDDVNSLAVPTSPLGHAFTLYTAARENYDQFVETQDSLREEFRTQNLEHRKWMYDVIGVDPGNDVDNPDDATHYYNPGGNYGCEIWQIDRSIERAQEQLNINKAEIQKILSQIETERWRRAQEQRLNASISNLYLAFGNQLAVYESILGGISGAQVLANNIVDGLSGLSGDKDEGFGIHGAVLKSLNGVFQAGAEVAKGILTGEKAKLAAQQSAQVADLQNLILDANSKALISNLFGEANLVAVQSIDLALALIQEVGSRQANIDEWHYREARMRENNAALLGRSFANPVHRLRMRLSMLEAETSFKVAQRWLFFTMRALEYKWNTPFVFTNETGSWSIDSLYRARTARDLVLLIAAFRDFNGLMQGSSRGDDRFDWFSFKRDFYGLTPVYDTDGVTEVRVYAHPDTGYGATATQVFQSKLWAAFDPETGIIELPFSTFRDNDLTFFRGPRRDPNDPTQVISRGQYLDKIEWMKVNLLGDFAGAPFDRVGGSLTYSGGSYVRNARVGTIPDPAKPNIILDEFTLWPTKFWFFDSGQPLARPPVPAAWRSSDEQTTEIALSLTDVPRLEMPDSVSMIDVFRERSVACDGWKLRIFTQHGGVPVITIDQIKDIEILFYHVSKDRPDLSKNAPNGLE